VKFGSFVYICDIKDIADNINEKQLEKGAVFTKADISNKLEVKKIFNNINKKNFLDFNKNLFII